MVAGDFAGMSALKTTDSVYWLSGEGSWPFGGYQSEARQAILWATVAERFPSGMTMTLRSVTADDERAILHVGIHGTRTDGQIYKNEVLLVLAIRNGLIHGLYEYLDTIMVNELFCGPLQSHQ